MNSTKIFLLYILFLQLVSFAISKRQIKRSTNNAIIDFRYNSCRIDAITRLPNNTLFVVSNGYYWVLNDRQTPRPYNVAGRVSQLYPKFNTIDAIFTDPINEVDPKIFLVSHSRKGIRVACQEFDGQYDTHNKFCHLPVDKRWLSALKDLDLNKPIDAATWRNRSKDKDEGFWVFFQGKKMIVIDPYKMDLRFTYDISKWMGITDTITATYYDYRTHSFHLFFDKNKYHIWRVNVTLMNSLPMGWDRAFLHGSLSPPMKINRDFFKFYDREVRDHDQPYLEMVKDEVSDDEDDYEEPEEITTQIVVTERLDNKLEEINRQKEFRFIPEISNELENSNKINSNRELSRNTNQEVKQEVSREYNREVNKLSVFKNSMYQQSDEASAVGSVVQSAAHAYHLKPLIYYSVLLFYIFYKF